MNIVIVEDSELVLNQLKAILASLPGCRVVGVAANEDDGFAIIQARQPDLIVLDIGLQDGSGLNLLGRLQDAGCHAWRFVLTNYNYLGYQQLCRERGADAFFDKSSEINEFYAALQARIPPKPLNEAARLQVLDRLGILDTPEEDLFNEVACLAARTADCPIALISLIGEQRQWFKARYGLDVKQTSRSVSFCTRALGQRELFVVEDALADERFADNPLVRGEPNIRFYAGMPLVMSGGEVLGTLCVIDHQPRTLDAHQCHTLAVLAKAVVAEFELRLQVGLLEAEVGRREKAEATAIQLATRDPLTGLPNRAGLLDCLDQAVRMTAGRDQPLIAFLFIDLDRFKWINDTLGHEFGDAVLHAVSGRLQGAIRGSDTVARLGGDEFGVILSGINTIAEVERICDKLVSAVNAKLIVKGHELTPGCSIGVALCPDHGESAELLLRHADLAMYEAKRAGGAGYRIYDATLSYQADERMMLETELRAALAAGEIQPWYQPQLDVQSGRPIGAEALLRWHHPRRGAVSPANFIPLAEECGLIQEMGESVLIDALNQLAAWDAEGIHIPRMAVNVSALQLRPEFPELVAQALRRSGLSPDRLELEVTESVFALDGPLLADVVSRLQAMGVALAVDDFGVGYSSLAQLKRIPVSTLKIDRAFTQGLNSDGRDVAIVQAITHLAEALGVRTVAEGVEDETQAEMLCRLGCDDVQGYFYARPMPPEGFADWVRDWELQTEGAAVL